MDNTKHTPACPNDSVFHHNVPSLGLSQPPSCVLSILVSASRTSMSCPFTVESYFLFLSPVGIITHSLHVRKPISKYQEPKGEAKRADEGTVILRWQFCPWLPNVCSFSHIYLLWSG